MNGLETVEMIKRNAASMLSFARTQIVSIKRTSEGTHCLDYSLGLWKGIAERCSQEIQMCRQLQRLVSK